MSHESFLSYFVGIHLEQYLFYLAIINSGIKRLIRVMIIDFSVSPKPI